MKFLKDVFIAHGPRGGEASSTATSGPLLLLLLLHLFLPLLLLPLLLVHLFLHFLQGS